MPAHGARLHLALRLTVVLLVAVAVVGVGGTSAALLLAPAGLIALLLVFGRYPGERVIRRLAARVACARPVRSTPCARRVPRSLGARMAALATLGAGRAPPAALLI